ncbi:hypothetical protein B0J11DRAFT_522092 [Dendryphion nanum]|uniref:DUF7730 domain-containing protein n=1 Tax=Dendryphion nanum TaxID=256645 RepID=A0A9P9E878_9PLEO|nr:hypothetical protein B0J11DRAFT_522092 [Dendryphion nanum]
MTLIYGNVASAPQMNRRLLNCLPGIRWVPSDIPPNDGERPSKSHRSLFSRKGAGEKDKRKVEARFSVHRRKSTLSLTSTPDAALDARTHPQGQCVFFALLPLEIRRMVYEYVMGEETVHLTLGTRRRFGHFVCEECQDNEVLECNCRVLVGGRDSNQRLLGVMGVLKSCRRMYSEAIPYLYSQHIFSLLHITHFLYLPTRVPAPRLDTIRILRVRWAIRALPYLRRPTQQKRFAYPEDTENWQRAWRAMSEMKGLRDLYVVLCDPSPQGLWERSWLELEDTLVEDIGKIKQCKWFEVVMPYASSVTEREIEGSNVRFRKPDGEAED